MGKHIQPYVSSLFKRVNEDAEVYSLSGKVDPYQELLDKARKEELSKGEKARIEKVLTHELESYWDNKKKLESAIQIAMQKLEENHTRMLEAFNKAVSELESIDARITNGRMKLDKLVLYMSESEKMHEFSDADKLFVYKIMKESYRKQTEACEEFLRATGAISDIMEYKEVGVSYDKEKEGGRYREPAFWHEITTEVPKQDPIQENLNESLFRKIDMYLRVAWEKVKNALGLTKKKVQEFEDSVDQLEKALKV